MRIKEDFQHTLIIERSRFLCYVRKCCNEMEAKEFIHEIRKLHPDASHHCYAYIAGMHNELQRSNDDGEPSGTAGSPILESLKKSDVQDVCAVVVRYFGGIKLGAGGLIRAYSRSTSETLKLAPKLQTILVQEYQLIFSYELIGKVDYFLKEEEILSKEYDIQVTYLFQSVHDEIVKQISELTNGKAQCNWIRQRYVEKEI